MKLSAIILTHNSEETLARALESISFSDEIIAIDDYSSDSSKEIAKKYGAVVKERELEGDFAKQRNFGLEHAKGNWILFLDSDELISEALKAEILKVIALDENGKSHYSAYRFKRRDFFWGKELHYGETLSRRKNGKIRLMKKNSGKWSGTVHEEFITTHPVSDFNGFIDHYSHESIATFLEKVNMYSSIRAKELKNSSVQFSTLKMIFYPLGKFIYTYVIKLGFLDGAAGFVYSFMMSFHAFLVRAKLLNL